MTEPPTTTRNRPSVGPLPVTEPMPMTAGRRMALLLGVPAALILMGSAAVATTGLNGHFSLLGDNFRNTYVVTLPPVPVRAGALTLAIDAGDAHFSSTAAGGDQAAPVTGTARYRGKRPSFTDRSTTAGTSLRSSCTGGYPPCSVSYAVAVPAGVAVRATGTSGDLTVRHLSGAVTLRDGTGDINGSALAGPVKITDESGDVTIGAVSGGLQITDGLGDVLFGAVTGPSVTIRDQSGDITGQALAAPDVTVTGSLGDITLLFTRAPARLQVTCSSGDVTIHLPHDGTAYRVTTKDSQGSVTVGVPRDAASPNVISVTDGTGDIFIGS